VNPESFCYWLQGFLEMSPDLKTLDEKQLQMLREHLQLVFLKMTGATQHSVMTPFVTPPFDASGIRLC
jgi:ABC-type histidine transport system ATPase subunit